MKKQNFASPKKMRQQEIVLKIILLVLFIMILILLLLCFIQLHNKKKSSSIPKTQTRSSQTETLSFSPSAHSQTSVENKKTDILLVNSSHPLSEDYSVELTQLRNNQSIASSCYPDLQKMMDDCRAEGLSPVICSSYRTKEKQTELFHNQIQTYLDQGYDLTDAKAKAATVVAPVNTSEHQLGLAVDIVDQQYQHLEENQENTPVQQWLMSHCQEYGFILRYPTDKSDITGIIYEPWHYRYVGKTAAKYIMENQICLEEYLSM